MWPLFNFSSLRDALLIGKLVHIIMMTSIFIYGIILYIMPSIDFKISTLDDLTLTMVEGTLGIVAILCIIVGYYIPRWMDKKSNRDESWLFQVHIVRIALFESVAIYGLVLGLMGVVWTISFLFLAVSLITMVLSFPTKDRWEKYISNQRVQ